MQTLIACVAVACAFGYGALMLVRSMRRLKREHPAPGCGACGSGCRRRKDGRYGEC